METSRKFRWMIDTFRHDFNKIVNDLKRELSELKTFDRYHVFKALDEYFEV